MDEDLSTNEVLLMHRVWLLNLAILRVVSQVNLDQSQIETIEKE